MADAHASIVSLSLRDFRNFERLELDFPPQGLVLIGDNGQGKTNLLEAVYYLSLLRSFRGARDLDVARFDAAGFFVDARFCGAKARSLSVGFECTSRRKRVRKDGLVVDRLSDALGSLAEVMFSPGDVEIVAGAATARRRFLDIMLALSSSGYLHALQEYRAALQRRNAVLRDTVRRGAREAPPSIETWEQPLAESGARIVRARRAWVKRIEAQFSERCAAVGERGLVELRYETSVPINAESVELSLAYALAAKRQSDLRYGVTQVGPHRDELMILHNKRDLRTFGSAGQQRTAAIALRTVEADTLRDAHGTSPAFLLDDPFAELDAGRASRVLALLEEIGFGQTVLAVPREADIPAELTDLPRRRVANGRILE